MAEFVIDTGSASVSLYMSTAKHSNKNLAIMSHNTWYYMPLIAPGDTIEFESKLWSYDPSKPTFCAYGDKQYVVPNKSEAVMTYDIPAGTYDPATFEGMIKSFISQNGSRKVANDFSVTVNHQTLNLKSGNTIYYRVNGSSYMGGVRAVWFNSLTEASSAPPLSASSSSGFAVSKAYVVYLKDVNTGYTNTFKSYSNFRITVTTGIKFA